VSELFEKYDRDGSGAIEFPEMKELLKDLQGGAVPSDQELEWIMKIADKDQSEDISEAELRDALLAWHGYMHLPVEYKQIFEEFDWDKNGSLDVSELQGALSKIAGADVSKGDAEEVLKTADVLANGVISKEEFLGAVGTWYVNVGRQPTHAMSVAFAALNRTPWGPSTKCSWALLVLSVVISAMMGYFALSTALEAGSACGYFLPALLFVDGVLWVVYAAFLVMKGRWVQALNLFLPLPRAAELVSRISGAIVALDMGVMVLLVLTEGVGLFYAFTEADLGKKERLECESTHTAANVIGSPDNLVGFAQAWFVGWTFPFTLLTLIYLIYCMIRIRRAFKHEGDLQADSDSDESGESTDSGGWLGA
jgi:Ca2+-binding EF-hand superfamily protein